MHFSREGESSNLERGVGDVVSETATRGLGWSDRQQVEDAGPAQPHLVGGPAHQGPEVHLSLGSVADLTTARHHGNIRLLRLKLGSMSIWSF